MDRTEGRDLYVFRSGRRRVKGRTLVEAVANELRRLVPGPSTGGERILGALLAAGALECALEDASARLSADRAGRITDELAAAYVAGSVPAGLATRLGSLLAGMAPPAEMEVSPAEGFAYYGLHPDDYRGLAAAFQPAAGGAVVVGIRTIGVTLSAVVTATLGARGIPARRLTVRPRGHPYDRRAQLRPHDEQTIRAAAGRASFLVVDEGPGLSGSSFLAVGEALMALGVPPGEVTFLCSRSFDPGALVARDALVRWTRFRWRVAESGTRPPSDAGRWVGGGAWRGLFWSDAHVWPPCWSAVERAKFLAQDGAHLFKFEGLGPYGRRASERAALLAEGGYLPRGSGVPAGGGYLAYPVVHGRPLRPSALSPRLLAWLADYCAFRASALRVDGPVDGAPLADMVAWNARRLLGRNMAVPLPIERPVVPDARLLPHEVVRSQSGRLYKLDSVNDGDDHLFPGPTDIAWDLAGIVFEWNLSPAAREALLDRYRQGTGDDARPRLDGYVRAYGLFRTAYWAMAAAGGSEAIERPRLEAEYRRCLARLKAEETRCGSLAAPRRQYPAPRRASPACKP